MDITYLGTNMLFVKKGSSTLLIDPYFTRPGILALLKKLIPDPQRIECGLSAAGINNLDGVLLTHTHFDHALDVFEVIRQVGGVLLGSRSASLLAKAAGMKQEHCKVVGCGNIYCVGEFNVQFHPSRHLPFLGPLRWLLPERGQISENISTPAYFWSYQCGDTYAIQVDQTLVFGSAGFLPGAYRDLDIETVIMAVGGLESKPASYLYQFYQEAVLSTGASQVLLSHWDNFFRPLDQDLQYLGLALRSVNRIKELGDHNGQVVKLLSYGETYLS